MSEHEILLLRADIDNLRRELRHWQDMAAGITICVPRDKILHVLTTVRLSRIEFEHVMALIGEIPTPPEEPT